MKLLIIDLLLQLKNASLIKKERLLVRYKKSYLMFLTFLYQENLILSFKIFLHLNKIEILLKYFLDIYFLNFLKILSTPSNSYFLKYQNILKIASKQKCLIFLTTHGLKTDLECKKLKLGGKILFSI